MQRAVGTSIQQTYATYTYTLNGKQKTVKDANGNLTTYEYDGLDRMYKMIFPSATLGAGASNTADYEQYGYDTVGNRTSLRKRDGVSITYVPDNLNRVRTKIVPASATGATGYTVVYGYDVRGLQTKARFGTINGTGITNVYDGFGWLRSSTTDLDGTARPVSYEYDAHGNRTRVMHPDGNYFGYQYEATDNLTLFNENGSAELIENVFDAFGRRQRIERNANTGSITTFTPDNISRLASIALNVDGTATTNDVGIGFSYNPASQVVARSQTNSLYDHQIPVVNQVYTRNGLNQYPSISGTNGGTLGYDLNGNLKSDGQATPTNYVYDAENRLVSASGAKNATLTYDPMGRLYQVSDAAGTQRFLYDGDRLILEYDGSGVVQRRYAHGAGVDEPLVWYEGSTVSSTTRRYLHADHQGSIINVTNAAGSTLLLGTYDAYGVTTSNPGRFQYTGQAAITQVGLYYYKARFYNPSLGRFMQTDPIGYDDDLNLYAYVDSDPLNMTDPTGNASSQNICGHVGQTSCSGVYETAVSATEENKDRNKKSKTDKPLAQEAAELLWPGYDLGTCISSPSDCGSSDWILGGVGVIPGGKGGVLGIKGMLKGLKEGGSLGVRIVESSAELRRVFDKLIDGAKPLDGTKYPGKLMEQADGTRIGLRESSKSGGATIDVHYPDGSKAKVHIEGGGS